MTLQEYITYYTHTAVPLVIVPYILILILLDLVSKLEALIGFFAVVALWFSGPQYETAQLKVDPYELNWTILVPIVSLIICIFGLKIWAGNNKNKLYMIYVNVILFLIISFFCFFVHYIFSHEQLTLQFFMTAKINSEYGWFEISKIWINCSILLLCMVAIIDWFSSGDED